MEKLGQILNLTCVPCAHIKRKSGAKGVFDGQVLTPNLEWQELQKLQIITNWATETCFG